MPLFPATPVEPPAVVPPPTFELVLPAAPVQPPVEDLVPPLEECSVELNAAWPPHWVKRGIKNKARAQLACDGRVLKLFPKSMNEVYKFRRV